MATVLNNAKLNRYLAQHASATVINRGLHLARWGKYTAQGFSEADGGRAQYRIRSEQYSNRYYDVVINNFLGDAPLRASCSCPFAYGGICKHIVAMLAVLDTHHALEEPVALLDMASNSVNLSDLSDNTLRHFTAESAWRTKPAMRQVQLLRVEEGKAVCAVTTSAVTYEVQINRVDTHLYHTSCTCGQHLPDPLCVHKLAALLFLRETFGTQGLEVMRDWTEDKKRLLAPYGFTPQDDLKGKFNFRADVHGGLHLVVLDDSLRAIGGLSDWWQRQSSALKSANRQYSAPKSLAEESGMARVLLFAFSEQAANTLPDLHLTALTARYDEEKDKYSHVGKLENLFGPGNGRVELPAISERDSRLINLLRDALSTEGLVKAGKAAGFNMPYWAASLQLQDLSAEATEAIQRHIGQVWEQVLPLLRGQRLVISPDNNFRVNSLQPVELVPAPARPRFVLRETEAFAELEAFVHFGSEEIPAGRCQPLGFWFLRYGERLAKIGSYADAAVLRQIGRQGKIRVKADYLPELLSRFVLPLTEHFQVDFQIKKPIVYQDLTFQTARIFLKEDESNLLIVPVFVYRKEDGAGEEMEFMLDDKHERVTYADGQITVHRRDALAESPLLEFAQGLHPNFEWQGTQPFFYLPFEEALKDQWLYRFFEESKAREVEVFGFKDLKKFKYNPNRPAFKIRASSGIDWFDLKMEIAFGDQLVSLTEIRKAVVNHQHYVRLGDGSIGLLPEDWLAQYATLFKFGQVKGDAVRLSKLHFSLIDELYAQIDDSAIQQEILEKKQKLLNFKEIKNVSLPAGITADLRDYQREGFKWLHFLDEFGWGGCLADDMGLGKTLQVLTVLKAAKATHPDAVHLIVMPTTLLFNWQAEVEKFAPSLRAYVHQGVGRERNLRFIKNVDLIFTTYGTLRSDIDMFRTFPFHYVVLDESQAIKNPDSKIAKAVKLLQARHRLVMTGTPVENNTFDLYSQMDFVNPGLLGGQEFFRAEFATPIDKYRDEDKARELRRLIYPFILKRTKEEVAKDLPDKTETTLFCEMGKKQRRVYETFRDNYRLKIMEKMAEVGKDKAAFLVLEGLLKLRQICDSPALLSDDVDYGEESAKLDELIREIEENAGHHKILVFSQFLKMLDLVRQHLEKINLPYEYLDGSTMDRASRVRNFQEDDQCRVFLMSLKAGGVGINLTGADYVYLIDPWWNPAVEQQAIDRTHRIGQTKKVFAYRMICKDTVEEKILDLQKKKKDIARDLISTEQGLIKKLSQEDIVGLFS